MTGLERVKAELMIFGIKRDYFGYGSLIEKMANGRYKAIVDGEKYEYSLKQLAEQWDEIDSHDREEIAKDFFNKNLAQKQ